MVSVLACLEIQTNRDDVHCEVYKYDAETQKWSGAINLYKSGKFHKHILTSPCDYDSSESAIAVMEAVVKELMEVKLPGMPNFLGNH